MTHALKALRVNLVNSFGTVGWPWAILAITFVANVAIFALLTGIPPEHRQTGALSCIYIVAFVANLQLWTQGFPFAMGLSITRKAYFGGTALFILLQSLVAGTALTLLSAIEPATRGWGIHMRFFTAWAMDQDSLWVRFLMYTVPFAAVCALGMVVGVVFKRWGQTGIYLLSIGTLLAVGGAFVLVSWRDAWGAVGRFFTDSSFVSLTAGYPALLAIAFGALAYLTLRRATP